VAVAHCSPDTDESGQTDVELCCRPMRHRQLSDQSDRFFASFVISFGLLESDVVNGERRSQSVQSSSCSVITDSSPAKHPAIRSDDISAAKSSFVDGRQSATPHHSIWAQRPRPNGEV